MKGGGLYTIRPIQPDDADMLQAFVRGLSQESRYFRFASAMPELPPRMLARYTLIDYDREMALVAVHRTRTAAEDGQFTETEQIIGVSRYITNPDQTSCEFSLVVSDQHKGQGLGSRLMLSIMEFARAKGLSEWVVTFKHALRNALMPVVTIAGLQFGHLISGAVLVETVFSWPGLGTLALGAIHGRDYPTLLGVLTFSSMLVIVANLVTDLSYRWIDPRLRGK
jgi:GNAT superfamily N-acetyltransferase